MRRRELLEAIGRHWRWGILPLVGAALFTVYRYLDTVAGGSSEPFSRIAVKEMGGGLGTALLLVPLVLLIVRFPLYGRRALRNLPAHILGVVVYSFLHTSWHWGFRTAVYALAGWGRYDYGRMPARYLMEFPLDLMTYVIVVVAVSMIQRARATRERELQMVRLQEQLQRARLAQLQSQLRPHFLFNALNTVSSVMYQDVDKADGVLQALADILRRMVDQSERTVVPLSEELALVDAMTQVMEARFGDRLRVEHDVDEAVLGWPVPPLVLQPLVENAIQHGMSDGHDGLRVRIGGSRVNGKLRLEVEDNGPGLSASGAERPGGVGLRNTRERLVSHFGAEGTLELISRPGEGLLVLLEVPWTD